MFKQILNLALEFDLPVNIHARNSLDDVIEVLKSFDKLPEFILHCFDGNKNQMKQILKLGGYISFNGLITYNDRNKVLIDAIKNNINVDKFVLETDAPYLAPGIYRGKQNKAQYNILVSQKIAQILNLNPKLLHEQMNLNALKIYKKIVV